MIFCQGIARELVFKGTLCVVACFGKSAFDFSLFFDFFVVHGFGLSKEFNGIVELFLVALFFVDLDKPLTKTFFFLGLAIIFFVFAFFFWVWCPVSKYQRSFLLQSFSICTLPPHVDVTIKRARSNQLQIGYPRDKVNSVLVCTQIKHQRDVLNRINGILVFNIISLSDKPRVL